MPYSAPDRVADLEEQVELLEFRIGQLLATASAHVEGVTPSQRRIVALIASRAPEVVPYESVIYAMTEDPVRLGNAHNTLKAQLSKARKTLKAYGISIETVWGVGYWMTAESKSLWQALLNTNQPQEAAAVA